jgi:hypothetical protein
MALDKNFPPVKEAVSEVEAAIDDLLAIHGRPAIYRPTSELLTLEPKKPLCSFCGKGINQVAQMMPGRDGAHICDQCVMLGSEAILMSREQHKGEH